MSADYKATVENGIATLHQITLHGTTTFEIGDAADFRSALSTMMLDPHLNEHSVGGINVVANDVAMTVRPPFPKPGRFDLPWRYVSGIVSELSATS